MDNKFEYTYSAQQQSEVEEIRKKYLPKTSKEAKFEELKRLDRSVENAGMIASLVDGIIGALIFGIGICCTMVWTDFFVLGIIVGIIGMIVCGFAYPIYKKVMKVQREKVAPQILKLTEEIGKE